MFARLTKLPMLSIADKRKPELFKSFSDIDHAPNNEWSKHMAYLCINASFAMRDELHRSETEHGIIAWFGMSDISDSEKREEITKALLRTKTRIHTEINYLIDLTDHEQSSLKPQHYRNYTAINYQKSKLDISEMALPHIDGRHDAYLSFIGERAASGALITVSTVPLDELHGANKKSQIKPIIGLNDLRW